VTFETDTGAPAAEQPILWLGMAGFGPQQRAFLESALARSSGSPRWRPCVFGDADAWWVNGAKVRVLPDGNLKVAAGLPTERVLRLNLSDVNRPVAFALPLASGEFEPRCTFDPASEPGIEAVLLQFESWLRFLRAQFVLGAQIIGRGAQLRHGIYQVSHRGSLLAVLDFQQGAAALSPRAHPADLWQAQWDKRPPGARIPPESFIRFTPAEVAWAYVHRTDRDLLPPRYRAEIIFYRDAPKVPLRWLRDSQLMLLRELAGESGSLEGLRQRTGLSLNQVERDLTCLYYANAITTTATKAAALLPDRQDALVNSSGPLDWLPASEAPPEGRYRSDLTAPVMLEHGRKLIRPSEDSNG